MKSNVNTCARSSLYEPLFFDGQTSQIDAVFTELKSLQSEIISYKAVCSGDNSRKSYTAPLLIVFLDEKI